MNKSILFFFLLAGLMVTNTASAATNPKTAGDAIARAQKASETATSIACLRTAVANREAKIQSGITTFQQSVAQAYNARGADLASAYAGSNSSNVKAAMKASWSNFKSSVSAARKTWSALRTEAWSKFRTSITSCKAALDLPDTANMKSEVAGD